MAVVTFDTLKFVETLEKEGFERKQASAIAHAVRDSQDAADVATKTDLRELETSTDSKFELLRKDMSAEFVLVRKDIDLVRKDMDALENRLAFRIGRMFVISVGIIIAAIGLAAKFL